MNVIVATAIVIGLIIWGYIPFMEWMGKNHPPHPRHHEAYRKQLVAKERENRRLEAKCAECGHPLFGHSGWCKWSDCLCIEGKPETWEVDDG